MAEPRSRLAAVTLALALAVSTAACGGGGGGEAASSAEEAPTGYQRTPAPEVGDLAFVDFSEDPGGAPYRLVAEEGGHVLFYFGYLSCPDVCPLTLGELQAAKAELPADVADRTEVALVTFDPARDEGQEVADYMANFFDDGYRALLAADRATLDESGERLGATWRREGEGADGSYFMAHSAAVYVIDDRGRAVWEFPFGTEPTDIADTIAGLTATG